METAYYIVKFIIKVLLFIIFLPAIILWIVFKLCVYRHSLKHSLINSGMPKDMAIELVREMSLRKTLNVCKN